MRRPDGQTGRREVTRREFVAGSLALTLGSVPLLGAAARLPAGRPGRFPLGIQLYTLRDLLKQDLAGTLAQLARLGCQEVEFAGTYGHPAGEVRKLLDRHHLKAPAGHCDITDVTDKLAQTIDTAKALGHRYVIVAWIPDELRTAEGYRSIADTFNRAGAALRKAGLTLGYHNHSFEFASLEGGQTGYDILLEHTDPALVTMELDLFWIRKGGQDAFEYFRRHRGRFSLVHVKDMAADGSMVDVGAGVMPWPELLTAARAAGVRHAFVEHDEASDPLAFARTSFAYMKQVAIGA
ncbi:MAG TPA: sugar phosphate isomerase/epimerase [Gemmatimonadales bacterium]|nr:sugar phosphate isomerase/epimerase [Gemmatimonadales bacterium]